MSKGLVWLPVLAFLIGGAAYAQNVSENEDVLSSLESVYQKVAEKAAPCVVSIKVEREIEEKKTTPGNRNNFPGLGGMDGGVFKNRPANSPVTGTILEEDGMIVTTAFNVNGKVKSIEVTLADGRTFKGELKGLNATYDLALIQIEAAGLPTLTKASLKGLKTGQSVIALGRAPDHKGLTINPGIVSAPFRMAGKGVQMDSRVNFGNVGGPLLDTHGHLIGITCRVSDSPSAASQWGQNSGVSFAVTWDRFTDILADLKQGKSVMEAKRAFLGVGPDDKAEVEGVSVLQVIDGSAAQKAGIKVGDVITALGDQKVKNFEELRAVILSKRAGDKVKVHLLRNEEPIEFDVVLGEAAGE